jgi:putative lipoprotein (rSAM/lipoprotein system)
MNAAIASLLALLGFASCGDKNGGDDSTVEYGTPYRVYNISGAVVDKDTKRPVEGIEVKVKMDSIRYAPANSELWTKKTGADGKFLLSQTPELANTGYKNALPIIATDIDGAANGAYKTDTFYVDYKNAVQTAPGANWLLGEFTATVTVELEKKNVEE